MIRFVWVAINTGLATLVFGLVAIIASLFRVRGRIYFWATQQWSRAVIWASDTPVVAHGLEEIDWDAPLVLVSNHISGYDIFALAAVLPAPFHFVGKKELDRIPFFGQAWRAAGHISIDRSNRARAMESLRRAGERIRREKGTVIIFPEGTRSRTGELQSFKKGAFILAIEAGIPVVPTVVRDSNLIQRPGSLRVTPRPIHVHFGAPIPTTDYAPDRTDELAERVRSRMLDLLRGGAPAARAPS